MKIYLIQHEEFNYDAFLGHVIVANTVDEVRTEAKKGSGDEGKDIWNDAIVTLEGNYTGEKTAPFKLLSDYRAG